MSIEPQLVPTAHGQPPDWPLPPSQLYALQHTQGAGRAVIARTRISPGTPLLATSPALSPVAHTLFRPYRREVCGWCFAYNRGRALAVRDLLVAAGVVFCSAECKASWAADVGPCGLEAYAELEGRERRIKRAMQGGRDGGEVVAIVASMQQNGAESALPSRDVVQDLIVAFDTFGENAKRVRKGLIPVQDKKKTAKQLSGNQPHLDADNLRLLLSGVLYSYRQRQPRPADATPPQHDGANQHSPNAEPDYEPGHIFPSLLRLQDDPDVYKTQAALIENLDSFVQLIARLPTQLLDHTSARLCHELTSRASHNAFSIRPPGRTDGDQSGEYFGWGIWPEASFFNHSCAPNVAKIRDGRTWRFTASKDITPGDQLCITYLGGDENDLDVGERRARLLEHWGFVCGCVRCVAEAGHVVDSSA